jgi:hypothetical protein
MVILIRNYWTNNDRSIYVIDLVISRDCELLLMSFDIIISINLSVAGRDLESI